MMKKVNRNNGAIDVTTVGGRIKKLRTDAGFTQEELAIELHLEGKSAISSYETNSRGVSAEMVLCQDLVQVKMRNFSPF